MISFDFKFDRPPGVLALVLLFVGIALLNLAIGFGITCLCTWLACMCFGFNWTIQFAAGIFFMMVILWWFVSAGNTSKNG